MVSEYCTVSIIIISIKNVQVYLKMNSLRKEEKVWKNSLTSEYGAITITMYPPTLASYIAS